MPDNILSNLLRSKIVMTLIFLASLAMLFYASAFAYQRYQDLLGLKAELTAAAQPVAGVAKDKPTVSGTRQVAALSLFGKKTKKTEPVPEVINAPITRLKLTLLGAIAADNTEKSSAIIQIDNKQMAVVQVGDPLPGTNAKIHQIQPTQVVLMRNGKLERLAILRPELENNAQGDEGDLLIKNSGDTGGNLLLPPDASSAAARRAEKRRTRPKPTSLDESGRPDLPRLQYDNAPIQLPPRK